MAVNSWTVLEENLHPIACWEAKQGFSRDLNQVSQVRLL